MMSRRLAFKQADVSRALKGAIVAGMKVDRVEIDQDGKIVLRFDAAADAPVHSGQGASRNEWDSVLG